MKNWEKKLQRRKRTMQIVSISLAVLLLIGVICIPLYSMLSY
ncbi:hypothetical protein [Massiliimalia timonensis]|nr:hypothetical protein [Massiliimalia timonensis]